MTSKTKIEWTDATWNPVKGCTRVSEGCRNCYAEVMAARFSDPGQWGHGLAQRVTLPDGSTDYRWTGKVELVDSAVDLPLRWRRPRRIFVNSTSDLFHEKVPDEWIDSVFCVMGAATRHTFQVLTKRPERMRDYLTRRRCNSAVKAPIGGGMVDWHPFNKELAVPPNVWLGTSIEDQATADDRIPHLLATPAAVRFLSCEPLLGPVDLNRICGTGHGPLSAVGGYFGNGTYGVYGPKLHWVICGGESGPGARPMHPDWARALRDQCQEERVPFFFKQWGEWAPVERTEDAAYPLEGCSDPAAHHGHQDCQFLVDGRWVEWPFVETFPTIGARRLGKKRAGRVLDGREWNEVPQ
jgi:protein gp37